MRHQPEGQPPTRSSDLECSATRRRRSDEKCTAKALREGHATMEPTLPTSSDADATPRRQRGRSRPRRRRSRAPPGQVIPLAAVIVLLAYIALPRASPFGIGGTCASSASGSAAAAPAASSSPTFVPTTGAADVRSRFGARARASAPTPPALRASSGSQDSSGPPPPPPPPRDGEGDGVGAVDGGNTARGGAAVASVIASLFSGVVGPAAGSERDWRDGEYGASLASKLTYSYVNRLLDSQSSSGLGGQTFRVPESRRVDGAVTRLQRIYDKCRAKARRRQEAIRAEEEEEEGEDEYLTTGGKGTTDRKRKKRRRKSKRDRLATSKSAALAKAILLSQRRALIYTGVLRLVNTGVQALPALLVSRLLRLIEAGESVPSSQPLGAAIALASVLSVKMLLENQYFHGVVKMSTQVRGSLAGIIFDKSLNLSGAGTELPSSSKGAVEEGEEGASKTKTALGAGGVMNLMLSDASIIESTMMMLHTTWDGILQIMIYSALLFRYLGPSVIYGMSVLLLMIPINSVTLRVLNRLSRYQNEAKDSRTGRTAESISNMKLLKLQSWEDNFAQDIQKYRREELRRSITRGAVRALNQAVSNAVPAITLVVTLMAYSKTGRPIVASTIFTAISLFNQLRFPLFFYPMLIDSLANGKNAVRRVSSYLSREEIVPYVRHFPKLDDGNGSRGGRIEMRNGNFLWSPEGRQGGKKAASAVAEEEISRPSGIPALCDANLTVEPGQVVAVVGPVGSGKTALIKGMLGELSPVPREVVDPGGLSAANGRMPSDKTVNGGLNGVRDIMDVPSVVTNGDCSYCAQESWLPKGTVRDAIVFGREYDEKRYLSAIYDAGLEADIIDGKGSSKADAARGMLSHDTDVGEGGSSLSGGQRARVALARALYEKEAGVYLLDDPLSALDASVGSLVFERVTARLKKENSAAVFVTNDPSLPRRCDKVVLMGTLSHPGPKPCACIVDTGTYDDLIARGHDLEKIVIDHHHIDRNDKKLKNEEPAGESKNKLGTNSTNSLSAIHVVGGHNEGKNDTMCSSHADPDCQVLLKEDPDYLADHVMPLPAEIHVDVEEIMPFCLIEEKNNMEDANQTAEDEKGRRERLLLKKSKSVASADDVMTTGAVPRSTYFAYLKAVRNPMLIIAMVLSYILANGAQFFQQYTVAKWTELGRGSAMNAALGGKYLSSLVYAAGAVSVFMWFRSYLTMRVGVKASEFFHSNMLSSVFGAPLSFFDATPSGQLLSRFGKEMETVDSTLPDGIGSVMFCFLQLFFSSFALAGVITPGMALPLIGIGYFYTQIMGRFRPAARDLKRSESISRAPIYTHFGEALRGAETIRSIPAGRSLWSSRHRMLSDENLRQHYSVKELDRWLSIRLETLGNVAVLFASVASVFLTRANRLKSGSAGWGITQALSITGLLAWAVRCLTDLETNMMSVMRITELTNLESPRSNEKSPPKKSGDQQAKMPREYTKAGEAFNHLTNRTSVMKLPTAPRSDASIVQSGWPWKGGIQFKGTSMRYNPVSPLVLKNLTLSVPPGSTLGVVGRTGSGKSSLLLTLFRIVEIEGSGSIEIDGVDIRSLSLRTLRNSLSIIPQDPVLFAGTVMYNLDATGKASKEEAWRALEAASTELARQFRNSGLGLESPITEGGKNLSVGQRQLICLARALLRNSKILVLDEATSSVDSKTDAKVQETIRKEFVDKGVTVMTVAHRLDTVLGYDSIAVLGDGVLLEHGAPNELLRKPNGYLRSLVDADISNKKKGARRRDPVIVV